MAKLINRLRDSVHLDRDNAWLFGVCAGLANYWRTDPAIVRVAAIVGGLFVTKITIAIYLVAWLILNDRPPAHTDANGSDLD